MEDIDDCRCKYNYDTNELEIIVNDEIIEINDLISKCVTEDIAKEILKYLLEDINSCDLEKILKIFYKISDKQYKSRIDIKKFKKFGGSNDINEGIEDIYDYRIYRLLECADTCHDFLNNNYINYEETERNIHEYIVENKYVLPNGLTANAFVKDNYIKIFIPYLIKQRTFIFENDRIDNPLFKLNILKQSYISEDIETLDELFKKHQHSLRSILGNFKYIKNRPLPVDVYMTINPKIYKPNEKKENTKIIYLKQIVEVISAIRFKFGNTCIFEVDSSNDHLTMLMCGIQNLSKAFSKEFDTEIRSITPIEISNKLDILIKTNNIPATSWSIYMTDANLYDSAEHSTIFGKKVDELSTGTIFRKECAYQIKLQGIIKKKDVNYLNLKIIDKVKNIIWDKPLLAHETTKYFSKNTLQDYITITSSKTDLKTLQDYILAFSIPLKYALKRAGDWGQVEHCKRHNKVFITSDKLAALYAEYCNIRFIFIRRQFSGDKMKYLKDLYRCTYVIF